MDDVFARILDQSGRADPYSLYVRLRETPVARQEDGSYVVSTYQEIVALLHDPRVSSALGPDEPRPPLPPAFIRLDPPEHDRLRRVVMRHFGPPSSPGRVDAMEPELLGIVTELIDAVRDRTEIDAVSDIAYPFPVTVICRLLGVPREDESRFHVWAERVVETFGPGQDEVERRERRFGALTELGGYLGELAEARRDRPGADLLSGLAAEAAGGELSPGELLSTATLLLIAGHETTVNLITNGMLTLLRHPDLLRRLRLEPGLVVDTVEELLRFEPPVHFPAPRVALADIEVAGVVIPAGATIVLALAAGSRDPACVRDPARFDPDRDDRRHLGFGGGVHYCFGAPLARLEAQIALRELARRLENPRLVADPPVYRPSSALRGPAHLPVVVDHVTG